MVESRSALDAYLLGQHGDFSLHGDLAQHASGPLEQAWALTLHAQAFLAGARETRLPTVAEVESYAGASPEVREVAGLASAIGARASVLRFDRAELATWVRTHELLISGSSTSRSDLWLGISAAWEQLLHGDARDLEAKATSIEKTAREHGYAALSIEAATVRAMVALATGEMDDAVRFARRASRMARTESLPQQEYLANLLLCRVRRISGAHHFATLIAAALLRVAPPLFRPALGWELFVAGGGLIQLRDRAHNSAEALGELDSLLTMAAQGDPARFDRAASDLLYSASGHAEIMDDVMAMLPLLDGARVVESESLRRWRFGEDADVPRGLHALSAAGAPTDLNTAYVLARPDALPRRVLAAGLPLHAEHQPLPALGKRQIRTDSSIATLLFAGEEGLREDDLFQLVYGFAFHERNAGTRRMLYTRIRRRLDGYGVLNREGGRISVECTSPFAVPDPRCARSTEDGVLRALARAGKMSAREAAGALGVPLRTAQEALKQLAEAGACVAVKAGSKLEYHLEDTTFREPTSAGWAVTPT